MLLTDPRLAEKIARMMPAVLQLPTPENCQLWDFVIAPHGLDVYHASDRVRFGILPDDLSVLNLGMVAEALDIAASTEGLRARLTLFLDARSDAHPWLRAVFEETDAAVDPLAEALYVRHSDRRAYAGGALADPVFGEAKQLAQGYEGARLYVTDTYPEAFRQVCRHADDIFSQWPAIWRDLNRWMRFWERDIWRTRDGLPWRSVLYEAEKPRHYWQSRLWWLMAQCQRCPGWLARLERWCFGTSNAFTPTQFTDGAGVACVTVTSPNPLNLVTAGRLSLRLWLLLNLRGYGFQAMTNLTCMTYPQRLGTVDIPAAFARLLDNSHDILRQTFGFAPHENPIFCFRTGLPIAPYPAGARTLRRTDRVLSQSEWHQHLAATQRR